MMYCMIWFRFGCQLRHPMMIQADMALVTQYLILKTLLVIEVAYIYIYTLVYASICYNTVYFLSCVIYRSVLVWLPVAPQFGPHDSPVDSFPDPKHPPHQPLGN